MVPTTKSELTFTADEVRQSLAYIEQYWPELEQFSPHDEQTLIGLPRPYFVPSTEASSGFMYKEIYYWDTFFTAQGFFGTDRQHVVKDLADNLLALVRRFHIVPNSGRFYHTGRSQPPFLTTLIRQVYAVEQDKEWLLEAMDTAKQEYRTVWMGTQHPNWRQVFNKLSRYYDIDVLDNLAECESGWDMTTRFMRQCMSYLPADLNALLYKYERDFEAVAREFGEDEEADEWRKRARERRRMMMQYLWNDHEGFFFDYNFMTGKQSPIWSLAGFFPMWAGMVDSVTAARIVANLPRFEFAGGLAATAARPQPRMPLPTQWAYPNGWPPLQYIVINALERYGYGEDAERLARKWIRANLVQFQQKGLFLEKYNVVKITEPPVQGLYPSQTGFGWTNAILFYLVHRYLTPEEGVTPLNLAPDTTPKPVRSGRR